MDLSYDFSNCDTIRTDPIGSDLNRIRIGFAHLYNVVNIQDEGLRSKLYARNPQNVLLLFIPRYYLIISLFRSTCHFLDLCTSLIENLVISSSTKKYGKSIGQNSGESRW